MVYIVDPINNTLIDDEKKEVPVRKPGAVPPKTPTIQKFKNGGAPVVPRSENLDERMQRMIYEYDGGPKPKHYDNPNIQTRSQHRSKVYGDNNQWPNH